MTIAAKLFDPTKTVLVVVDEQERLLPLIYQAERLIRQTRKIIRVADAVGLPVLFTEQYPKGLGPTTSAISELFGDRAPIVKTAFGCFGCTEFAEAVGGGRYDTLLLAGAETHICVFQTAAQALEAGLAVHVLTDAVSAGSPEDHAVGLHRLQQAGAITSSTTMAIYEFLREAATPTFRRVLPLLKE